MTRFKGALNTAVALSLILIAMVLVSCIPNPVEPVNSPPELTLLGKSVDSVSAGIQYVEPGAFATDAEDGILSDSIYVNDGLFDRANPSVGKYLVTYFVFDKSGLSDSATRTIVAIAGGVVQSDTVIIQDPISGSNVYKDTSKIYLVSGTRLTIPSGSSITFGSRTTVIVKGKIYVLGALAIDTGAGLYMGKDGCIETYTGQLNIRGSDSLPVMFRNLTPGVIWGTDPTTSNSAWASYGIEISENANANSSIQFCIVDSSTTGINIRKDGLLLSNIAARYNKYSGIYFDACGPRDSTTFEDIYLIGNGTSSDYFPFVISSEYMGRLSDSLAFSGNGKNAVLVRPGIVKSSGIWKALTVPYVFDVGSYVKIDNANGVVVTVAPGAQLRFMTGTYIDVYQGTFIANGTVSKHIDFDTWVPGTYWGYDYGVSNYSANHGIYFEKNATSASKVSYCDFKNATQGISSYDSPVQVANCSFVNNKYYGIHATANGKAGIDVSSCTFSGNGSGPYYLAP